LENLTFPTLQFHAEGSKTSWFTQSTASLYTDQRPLAPSIKKISDIGATDDLDLWLGEDWQ